jgi:hypothetical protein
MLEPPLADQVTPGPGDDVASENPAPIQHGNQQGADSRKSRPLAACGLDQQRSLQ